MTAYHDTEWGVPSRDDGHLFEMLVLEGAQAGLTWLTVLQRRAGYRAAFAGFDPKAVAAFGPERVEALLLDPGIIRNRRKIEGAVANARAFLALQAAHGRFADYLWGFVDGVPVVNAWRDESEIPATSPLAEALSRDLRRRGFTFVGPTICYAFLQAVGVVDDHVVTCFRRAGAAQAAGT